MSEQNITTPPILDLVESEALPGMFMDQEGRYYRVIHRTNPRTMEAGEVEFNAKRLRRVVDLAGLASAVPESDTELLACMGSVLGMVARQLEANLKRAQSERGQCIEGNRCVCGGDVPAVRATCANWTSVTLI